MKRLFVFTILVMIISASPVSAQSDKEKALKKGQEAVKIMDEGKINESIKLLEEAQKLDPSFFDYPYELALAHYMKEDYKGAIKILEKIADHKNVKDRLFQLLGNSYDMLGKSDVALKKYDEGLKKFPNSGMLFLEKGNVYWGKKEYEKALPFYEQGIEIDPSFPSNYYRAARIYCNSSEAVWGMIYGEIFMNLERNSKRTAEISQLLFDTYKSQIKITSDTSLSVSFCKNMITKANDILDPKKFKLPFCMIYEPTLMLAIPSVKKMDIAVMNKMRSNFVESYYQNGHDKTHPNVLFDYQNKMVKAGQMEAYNYWILMKGEEDSFSKWQTANKDKWDSFIKWFNDNPLNLDASNHFYRNQY